MKVTDYKTLRWILDSKDAKEQGGKFIVQFEFEYFANNVLYLTLLFATEFATFQTVFVKPKKFWRRTQILDQKQGAYIHCEFCFGSLSKHYKF